ncbi:hypothetical protein BCR33DRAFT_732601 [Rhizoclosmatium globosum]|uniref:Uncharacterized protein n=1 Tax=Rhizoclosmatium globosum TaxID=329046 RepID=A0A1Y2D3X3_9FUNG|nr:hypothetical protein BCR33DRAFT_732601 [Rhizoclosmatium globosum]|eukprot:ORY53816.1 hypothetical protein BCR33DRAFT_732601 [Rhizoclosmatium globosum]
MAARRPSLAGSHTSSTLTQVLKYKPRLFALMAGFITACAVTVGVLGWQLTLAAGKQNVGALIEEIEYLVSNQVSNYILKTAQTLAFITAKQAEMFRLNQWSYRTLESAKNTFDSQLIELQGVLQYTTSMYMQTYPEGYQIGYNYAYDANGVPQLQWWNQSGDSFYTYNCDLNGTPVGSPVNVNIQIGNGTLSNPGNNNTLLNAVGGTAGVNLEYGLGNTYGFTNRYVFTGYPYKTWNYFTTNQVTGSDPNFTFRKQKLMQKVTGEQAVFGNDWTLSFISSQIRDIIDIVSFPIFAAVVECDTGYVVGTSSFAATIQNETLLTINEINDPFFQDLSNFVNSTYRYGSVDNVVAQLGLTGTYIEQYFPGATNWFVERKLGTENWKLGLNAYKLNGKQHLFVVYMNIDSVESQFNKLSSQTGYMMIGIIGSFVVLGALFAILISRQLYVVVKQIQLLKDLKFREVLGTSAEIKDRSFIYELAELQKCFHTSQEEQPEQLSANNKSETALPPVAVSRIINTAQTSDDNVRQPGARNTIINEDPLKIAS